MTVWVAPTRLGAAARRAFHDMVPYCLPAGAEGHVTAGPKPAVEFTVDDAAAADRIATRLAEAFARSAATADTPPTVVHDQWDLSPATAEVPAARQVGPGLFVAEPGVAGLMWELDAVLRDAAVALGAAEYVVPHLITWTVLDRAGYPRNFPQHLLSCDVVGPDLAALDRFAEGDAESRAAELRPAAMCLAPAVCLHLFASWAGSAVSAPKLATARGACGRHEATDTASVIRPWSFTMREIVFVGDHEQAVRFRDHMLELLTDLATALGVPARIVSANDPFFGTRRGGMTDYQARFEVKHELCGRLAGGDDALAVASVNFHDQHFGAGFGITTPDGAPARSVCVGFGLERWAYWLRGYAGNEPADIRETLRQWRKTVVSFS